MRSMPMAVNISLVSVVWVPRINPNNVRVFLFIFYKKMLNKTNNL
jgi:hypothetical protein